VKTQQRDGKAPGFWFYTADYERDMQMLPLAAQGLWMRMLCWMHENEAHRGFLELPTGLPMTEADIAAKVGKSAREVERAILDMERIGTFSRNARGCIFSRRMARDIHISDVRRKAANARLTAAKRAADGTFAGELAPANQPTKDEQTPAVTVSVSVSDSSNTPSPQNGDAIGCKFSVDDPPFATTEPDALFPAEPLTPSKADTLASQQTAWFTEWWGIYWRRRDRKNAAR